MNLFPSRYLPEAPDPDALSATPAPLPKGPTGILVVNLGTPDEPTPKAIRRYLLEFLSDPRVIELPQWLWQIILRGIVLVRRPHHLAPRYEEIWHERGSPLLVWSQAQADGVQQRLRAQGLDVRTAVGMRYGNPSIASAIDALRSQGCERILCVPLYPQYAASTTATAVDHVARHAARLRNQPELRFIKRYHADPGYIDALARQVQAYWAAHGKPERLLLSFHGLPRVTVEQGDPYHRDCMETLLLLRQRLGEDGDRVHVAFQSRFGAQAWLQPYTEPLLREWAKQGVGSVDVMCPGFLADCLETLEEIQMQCRDAFLEDGGKQFRYLPCLNDDPVWADALTEIVRRHMAGW
ncbi:ferrochelatase [Paracandidimonas soli]|uniref:Ferrochelatase n=1 Tax=Paracandidimonas soli TaxID=1917182 RepID=A0A4R3V192_9BURK|nr:ferrochelatase [Paracandidimonas soli]